MLFKLLIPSDKAIIIDCISKLPESKQYTIEVRVKRHKRTIDQNRLYWAWLSCISEETGNEREYLHELFKQKYLGCQRHELHNINETVIVRRSTSSLDTKQMAEYMDKVQRFANTEIGIVLPSPDDRYCEEFMAKYRDYI